MRGFEANRSRCSAGCWPGLCPIRRRPGQPTTRPTADAAAASKTADRERPGTFITIKGVRVGYGHTTLRHATKDGRDVVLRQRVHPHGRPAIRSDHRPGHEVCSTGDAGRAASGLPERNPPRPDAAADHRPGAGRPPGNTQTTTSGKPVPASIPWSADYGGFFAVEESLLRQPMKPGEKRTVHALDMSNLVIQTDLTARGLRNG